MFHIKFGLGVLIAIFISGCVAQATRQTNSEVQSISPQSAGGSKTDSPENVPAITVHIDPQTGQIITPPSTPPSGELPQPPLETAKPALPPLQQRLSPVPGGGVMIELDDRFQTPLTATIDAAGKVRFEHKPSVSGTNDRE